MVPVLSASSVHGGKKELLIFVSYFVGQQTSQIIVYSCRVKGHLTQKIFFRTVYIHNLKPEKKSVAMAIVARYCRKSNQFQSVQGLGMHRTHKNICKSKKQKESDAVATLVASYCRKLISSNLYRGMECKEPIKLFISLRNKKGSIAIATLVAR